MLQKYLTDLLRRYYRQTHTDTHRHTQTHTDTHRHTQTHADTHRHTQTHTDTHRHTHTHTDTHRHTNTHTHTSHANLLRRYYRQVQHSQFVHRLCKGHRTTPYPDYVHDYNKLMDIGLSLFKLDINILCRER